MADNSKLIWTDATWNFITGCNKISAGCKHCYAERDWETLASKPNSVYFNRNFTDIKTHPERLTLPLKWNKSRKIFVNSMSDLFLDEISPDFIAHVFAIMAIADNHIFQVLTKRSENMRAILSDPSFKDTVASKIETILNDESYKSYESVQKYKKANKLASFTYPLPNVWIGVTAENQVFFHTRVIDLVHTPACVRWVSIEPMLGAISVMGDFLELNKIDWIVLGGESGDVAKVRIMNPAWVYSLVNELEFYCLTYDRKIQDLLFFKQWGSFTPVTECKFSQEVAHLTFWHKAWEMIPTSVVYPDKYDTVGNKTYLGYPK